MMRRTFVLAAILCMGISLGWAQGRGGQAPRKGAQAPQGQGQRGAGTAERDRDRVRASQEQMDQVRACDRSAQEVRNRARRLAAGTSGSSFDADRTRREWDQLRERVRLMQQEHERLMAGLSDEQKQALQERVRVMNEARERVLAEMQRIDQELGRPQPDARQLAERAREMERAARELQQQFQALRSRMIEQR